MISGIICQPRNKHLPIWMSCELSLQTCGMLFNILQADIETVSMNDYPNLTMYSVLRVAEATGRVLQTAHSNTQNYN